MPSVPWVFIACVGAYTAAAAVIDSRLHRVPNYLTVPAAVLGLAYHALAPSGWGIAASLGGFAAGFLLLLLPWAMGGGGMGDVKLLAALGAWLGPVWVLVAFGVGICFACILMVAMLIKTMLFQGWGQAKRSLQSARSRARGPRRTFLPFAVPVAAATWSILAWLWLHQG